MRELNSLLFNGLFNKIATSLFETLEIPPIRIPTNRKFYALNFMSLLCLYCGLSNSELTECEDCGNKTCDNCMVECDECQQSLCKLCGDCCLDCTQDIFLTLCNSCSSDL